MRDPFIIPTLVDEYTGAVEDYWENRATTGVYLLHHWLMVSLRVVSHLQRNPYKNCNDDKEIVSCEWTKELFVISSDPALIKRLQEKYEALDGIQQGGIIYHKIVIDDMFNTSDVIITSIQEFFNKFAQDGVAKYPSENVALLVQKINSAAERLEEVPELPKDTLLLVLTGFTKCDVTKFVGQFELMINIERLIQLENDGDRHDIRK